MKTIEEASEDYLNSDRYKNIDYDEEWKNELTFEIEKETKRAFHAGANFIQTWININDELPPIDYRYSYQETSIFVNFKDEGDRIYSGFYDYTIKKWDSMGYEIEYVTSWKQI